VSVFTMTKSMRPAPRIQRETTLNFTVNGYGVGFVLEPDEAKQLIDKDPRNKDVLFPYLNGEDLNSRPDQSPSRWVINFFDWPLNRETAPKDYEGPVAADYPDCLAIVEEKVRPERMKNNRQVYRDRWWHYAEKRPELYRTIAGMERVLVISLVSNKVGFGVVPNSMVFSHKLAVFALPDWTGLAPLGTAKLRWWARWMSESRSHSCLDSGPNTRCGTTGPGEAR